MTSPGTSKSDVLPDAQARAASRIFALSLDLLGSAGRDGYFTALNPAWERALGFSRETLMKQPFMEFVHPADREATIAEFERWHSSAPLQPSKPAGRRSPALGWFDSIAASCGKSAVLAGLSGV